MSSRAERPVIAAAGGVVWRPGGEDGGIEIAVVHRERHDDWSLPKGHVDAGEHALDAAVREVFEETGLGVVVGRRSLTTRYEVDGVPKRVDYWVMRCVGGGGGFTPNDEVDELRWLSPTDAALCSYPHDREVIADAARTDLPREVALLLVRHGKAGKSDQWSGPDEGRPLTPAGEEQARGLVGMLLFGPTAVLSATPLRCRQTVTPLALHLARAVEERVEWGEPEFGGDPQRALEAALGLLEGPGVTVVCSQGGMIPAVLQALGVHGHGVPGLLPPAAKGSFWALGGRPGALVADYYRDFDPDPDARP